MTQRHFHFFKKRASLSTRFTIDLRAVTHALDERIRAPSPEIGKTFLQRGITQFRPRMETSKALLDPDQCTGKFPSLRNGIQS